MFAILISEKGGAERRETFEQTVVTIGRVHDNDLTLAKGNVSKRHCRLEYMNGRFIVTDEDSTNGTYVNRRKITQPTPVRAGDRIYVGDFVLRVEGSDGGEGEAPAADAVSNSELEGRATLAQLQTDGVDPAVPVREALPPRPSLAPPSLPPPSLASPSSRESSSRSSPTREAEALTPLGNVSPPQTTLRDEAPRNVSDPAGGVRAAARSLIEEVFRRVEPRVFERALDRDATERLERILVEQATQLASLGHALTQEHIAQAVDLARAELMGLGPLGALLEDPAVVEVVVTGASSLVYSREGFTQDGAPFCHPRAVEWVLGRLCRQSGAELGDEEVLVRRVLPNPRTELQAVRQSACPSGALLRVKRWRASNVQLDDLVQTGTLSRAMATFLRHCVMARANVMIVGRRDAGTDDLLTALAALVARERVLWLSWSGAHPLPPADADFSLVTVEAANDTDALLDVLTNTGHRMVAAYPTPAGAKALLQAACAGLDGLLLLREARTADAAVTRFSHEAVTAGISPLDVSRSIAGAFDVIVEVVRLGDGRSRVMRIAEPGVSGGETGAGDIFDFVVERTATGGSIEGNFRATGRAPTLLKGLRARGIAVEEALFSRPASD